MLGESHALLVEFPEYRAKLESIMLSDASFKADANRYHALDEEIRQLELRNAPIDDASMHQLKHDRAELKDALYRRLQRA
ncbi:YdcH family protein [Ferrimonas futtsuensis]|uniref:YdcH family protein n=1 Tax=Ferrimonas futtsuensis TaxID=364764 RepID=UPI000487F36C|nr:YdcH family protein [Ferrimonas futtsuensis]